MAPYKNLTLEDSIEFIPDDELVEVTPKFLRLRKRVLQAIDVSARRQGGGTRLPGPCATFQVCW